MFDPNEFLQASFTESSETASIPCPQGEFPGLAESVDCRRWQKKDDPDVAGVSFTILWSIQDDDVKATCKRDKVIVKQDIMMNFIPGTESLDMEKAKDNVQFGRLREALGMNDGEFNFSMVPGNMALCKVKHRAYEGEIYAEVRGIAAIN